MNTKAWKAATLAVFLSVVSVSGWAHHSIAGLYDLTPITLSGTVAEFRLANPHSTIVLDVPDADGKLTRWEAEIGGVNVMVRNFGWTRDTLRLGDKVTLTGIKAKNGEPRMDLGSGGIAGATKGMIYLTESKRLLFRTQSAELPPGVEDVHFPMYDRFPFNPSSRGR